MQLGDFRWRRTAIFRAILPNYAAETSPRPVYLGQRDKPSISTPIFDFVRIGESVTLHHEPSSSKERSHRAHTVTLVAIHKDQCDYRIYRFLAHAFLNNGFTFQ